MNMFLNIEINYIQDKIIKRKIYSIQKKYKKLNNLEKKIIFLNFGLNFYKENIVK